MYADFLFGTKLFSIKYIKQKKYKYIDVYLTIHFNFSKTLFGS